MDDLCLTQLLLNTDIVELEPFQASYYPGVMPHMLLHHHPALT